METLEKKDTEKLPPKPERNWGRELFSVRVREYLSFDSFVCRKLIALLGLVMGSVLSVFRRPAKAFRYFSTIHRAAYSEMTSKMIERWLRSKLATKSFVPVCTQYLGGLSSGPGTAKFYADPGRMLGTRLLVLKSPAANEKGVVVIDYSFILSLFAKKFDVARLGQQYYIVLEPSWSGYCDLDILCYSMFDFPVFVQTPEPRDVEFLSTIRGNLIPVPIGANWWVDHRVFRPLPDVTKDFDVLMIAAWGRG